MSAAPRVSADAIVRVLRAHEPELRQAGIQHLSVFGSVARGDATADSEVDLAAELRPDAGIGLLRLAAIERRLGEILGCTVDLLAEPVEKPRLRARIDQDRQRAF